MRAMREESEGRGLKGARGGFWSSKKILTLFLLLFGIILGIIVGHYVVEPVLSSQYYEKYIDCESANQLLDAQINDCLGQLNDCKSAQPP